jgi:hypothetical protein
LESWDGCLSVFQFLELLFLRDRRRRSRADTGGVSRRTAVVIPILALMLVGCAPGRNEELETLVDDVAPARRDTVSCEWESRWGGSGGTKSAYACIWYVPGTIARVGKPIVARAVANGFAVYCNGADGSFEVGAMRGKQVISARVLARGFRETPAISEKDVDIPPGHVLVAIGAFELGSQAQHPNPAERCVA